EVTEVVRWWQLNSTEEGVDANQRLHCEYSRVVATDAGPKVARAEYKTSGSCDFDSLKTKAGAPSTDFPKQNFNNILTVLSGEGFDPTTEQKATWDCAVIKVTTTQRTLYGKDCMLRDRTNAGFKDALTSEPSASAEAAGFRLNQL